MIISALTELSSTNMVLFYSATAKCSNTAQNHNIYT